MSSDDHYSEGGSNLRIPTRIATIFLISSSQLIYFYDFGSTLNFVVTEVKYNFNAGTYFTAMARTQQSHNQTLKNYIIFETMLISKTARSVFRFSNVEGEPSFLKLVEGYFNKAAAVAGIPEDRIDFLRSP